MTLLEPYSDPCLGEFKNRVVMAPMTRNSASPGHLASPAMAAYYARRSAGGVGLILTEGTIVDASGDGYRDVPYIADPAQAQAWRPVVEAVHGHGTKIFCQLWHCGRISHADFTGGHPPVSSTDRAAAGINRQNGKPFDRPRPLAAGEMPALYDLFGRAAINAMEAGFDGVELHLGHGYLADQFLDGRVNDRRDSYGGSVANRCRFALELTSRIIACLGAARVIVRISPARDMGGPYDWPDLDAMLDYLLPGLAAAGLRALDISCANADYYATAARPLRRARPMWPYTLIGGASLSRAQAEHEIATRTLDLVTWGRALIANADLPQRFATGVPLTPFHPDMLKSLE